MFQSGRDFGPMNEGDGFHVVLVYLPGGLIVGSKGIIMNCLPLSLTYDSSYSYYISKPIHYNKTFLSPITFFSIELFVRLLLMSRFYYYYYTTVAKHPCVSA